MSPSEALQSPVFLGYVAAAVGLLAGAGIVLAVLRWGLRRDVDHACRSYLGWLLMVPPVLGAIFLGREAAIVVFTIIGMMGFKEFARATGLYEDWWMTGVIYLGILAVGVLSLVTDPFTHVPGWYGMFIALPVYVIASILVIPILRNRAAGQLQAIALAMLGFVYFGWMFGHLAFLCNARFAYAYVLYLLFAVEINDVAAYTCGKLFGKHPLRSNISPKKTWEGSLGALGVSLLLPWLLHGTFPHFGALECVFAGLIVGIGGQLGDLAISVISATSASRTWAARFPVTAASSIASTA